MQEERSKLLMYYLSVYIYIYLSINEVYGETDKRLLWTFAIQRLDDSRQRQSGPDPFSFAIFDRSSRWPIPSVSFACFENMETRAFLLPSFATRAITCFHLVERK